MLLVNKLLTLLRFHMEIMNKLLRLFMNQLLLNRLMKPQFNILSSHIALWNYQVNNKPLISTLDIQHPHMLNHIAMDILSHTQLHLLIRIQLLLQ